MLPRHVWEKVYWRAERVAVSSHGAEVPFVHSALVFVGVPLACSSHDLEVHGAVNVREGLLRMHVPEVAREPTHP